VERGFRAFNFNVDRAVGLVAGKAGEAQDGGGAAGGVAEEHALNVAGNGNVELLNGHGVIVDEPWQFEAAGLQICPTYCRCWCPRMRGQMKGQHYE
jgi:hypothetical protein